MSRSFQQDIFFSCNELCKLRKPVRKILATLEEQLCGVSSRQQLLLRDVKTLEARSRVDMAEFGTTKAEDVELK